MAQIYLPPAIGPLRQGEILSNLVQIKMDVSSLGLEVPIVVRVEHPYAIVITQDCDLDWDFKARKGDGKQDKLVPSVLFCQVMTAAELRGAEGMNREKWSRVKTNKNERYHFFEEVPPECDGLNEGLVELGADFKKYFTLSTDEIYKMIETEKSMRRCRLQSPYLEHFSTRFAYYQFRVALPEEHFSQSED